MRQIHAQHRIARLQRAHINRNVRLRSGVRLHIGMLRSKQFLRTVNRKLLHFVGKFAAAVVPLARIPLRILVREDRAHRFQHRFRHQVFRGDQLQPRRLPLRLFAQQGGDLRINLRQRPLHSLIRFCRLAHVV
jgi:hypothetical protein